MGKRIKCNNVSYIRTVRGVYIGRIENGQKNGWGLQINNNGNKYEGLFKNDEKYLFGLELICCLCGHTYRNKVQNGIYEKGKIHYKDVNNISAYNNDDQHDNIHHEKVYHENIHHEKVYHENIHHEKVYHENIHHEKVYHDNINHEKVYHGNIYDHNIYHNNKFNFQYSSENEFAKGNICVHENRYIYIGTYKKGKKHGKGILINYNNYFMYSCIFYKNKIIYVDMLFSKVQKYMNMKNIDMKHYNTHKKKKIYLFLQKEYKNKILGFINFYKHITHKIKKKQENVHDKITFLKCLKELFFVTHTNKENNQMEGIIHTYKNYTINKNDNTYNIFKEKLHNITQGGNKTQHEKRYMKTIYRHAGHENVILNNKRKEKNKSTNMTYNIIPNKRETIVDDINSCSNNFTTRSNTDNANSYHMNMYSDSNNFYGNKKKKIKKRNNNKCEYSSIIKNKNQLYNDQIHNNTCVCIKFKTKCCSFKINKLEKKKKESYKCNSHKELKQHDKNLLFNNYIFNDNFLDNVFVLKPPMDEEGKKKNYDKLKRDTFPLFLRKKKKKLFQAQNYIYWNIFELNLFFFLVGIPKEILEIFIYHRLDGYCLKYIDKKILKEMKIKNRMMRKYIYLCIQYLLRLREKYKYKKKSNSKLTEKINEDFILKKEQLHILNLIGRGGYSNVYRCIYGNKNILRINKFFDIHYSINNTALKIFLNKKKNILEYFTELYIVSNLRHPNVTLFLGAINNPRAIVLEYIQYGTLFDILHKYKINMKLQDIIKISKDITAFMSFLHNKGIMHCDLKSSNILISITRDIKICDFGLSVFNKYNKPKYLGIVGTYQWTAPEVLRSEGYTKEADIYSFGVILWEMIHRKIPFSDMKNPLDIIAHVGYANKKLSVTNKNIPDQLKYILHSCLHKNTHKRKSFLFWSEYFDFLYNVTDIPKEDHTSFFF
ncbi:TKL protein kinase [Plasmodium falciparum NF54]|uniref:TKL protein kinase n=1 Tax=Plasmodium falciparum (isolate NF54) TaxID=5843 RepID=W7JYR2_PLAFO|nr:TKL protein kinase [Plasmodium falciparum NF54]